MCHRWKSQLELPLEPNWVWVNVLAVILAWAETGGFRCIIQRGWEIMRHLCPCPGGPVTTDPQPLTFSEGSPRSLAGQCIRLQPCGCLCSGVFGHESAWCWATFLRPREVQVRSIHRDVFSAFLLMHKPKVELFSHMGLNWSVSAEQVIWIMNSTLFNRQIGSIFALNIDLRPRSYTPLWPNSKFFNTFGKFQPQRF